MTGCGSRRRRHARGATGAGPRRDRGPGTGRSCAGSPSCRRRPAARGSRPVRGRRGSAHGSSCPARRDTGRRPCARVQRGGVRAGRVRRRWRDARASPRSAPTARRTWSRVVTARVPSCSRSGPSRPIRVPRRPSDRVATGYPSPRPAAAALPRARLSRPGHRCRPACGTSCPARRSGAAWPGCADPAAR